MTISQETLKNAALACFENAQALHVEASLLPSQMIFAEDDEVIKALPTNLDVK